MNGPLTNKKQLTALLTLLLAVWSGAALLWPVSVVGQQAARIAHSQNHLRNQSRFRLTWPEVNFDRRNETAYIDSMLAVGHQHLAATKPLPQTPANDTLRLEALRFLAVVFKQIRAAGRDSSYYYAHQLVGLATTCQNDLYAVRGLMLEEYYFRVVKTDYPRALQLNQQAAEQIGRAHV